MRADELTMVLKRSPFRPFRVMLTSGTVYEVTNPDLVVVMKSEMFIAFTGEDRWAVVPLIHVASIEMLQAA